MHWLLTVAQLISHLGDEGLLSNEEAQEKLRQARTLTNEGFDEGVVIEALFCWSSPEIRARIAKFHESQELHAARERLRIPRCELLVLLRQRLAPNDLAVIERQFDGHEEFAPGQILHFIPAHYPRIVDLIVDQYLSPPTS